VQAAAGSSGEVEMALPQVAWGFGFDNKIGYPYAIDNMPERKG